MISNLLCLACLPFWGETCQLRSHEDSLHQAIIATKKMISRPTCQGLIDLAWDLDAAKFYDYNGPDNCTCVNKTQLADLLVKLYVTVPIELGAHHMWALDNAWDEPIPQL